MESKPLNIGIIGGGPAGLLAAVCFSRRENLNITIFEEESSWLSQTQKFNPDRSYTIDITGHGYTAIKYANLVDAFDAGMIPFKGINFYRSFKLPGQGIWSLDPCTDKGWSGSRSEICCVLEKQLKSLLKPPVFYFQTRANLVDVNKGILEIIPDINSRRIGLESMESSSTNTQGGNMQFDLIVACDGAGSSTRNMLSKQISNFSIKSRDFGNHGCMILMDRNTEILDPGILHIFGFTYFTVAGAIRHSDGSTVWFAQITAAHAFHFSTIEEAINLIKKVNTYLLHFISDDSLNDFSKRAWLPIGKGKVCSQMFGGRVILLGDAAAVFPPFGQGVSAAMESATVLDSLLGGLLSYPIDASTNATDSSFRSTNDIVAALGPAFNKAWNPEAQALWGLSSIVDARPLSFAGPRFVLSLMLGYCGGQLAKKSELKYSDAYRINQKGGKIVIAVFVATAGVLVAYFTRSQFVLV